MPLPVSNPLRLPVASPIDMATLRMLTRRETGFARLDLRVLRKQIRFKLRTAIGQSENRNTFDALEWRNYSSCWRNTLGRCGSISLTSRAPIRHVVKGEPGTRLGPLFPSGFDLVMVPGITSPPGKNLTWRSSLGSSKRP